MKNTTRYAMFKHNGNWDGSTLEGATFDALAWNVTIEELVPKFLEFRRNGIRTIVMQCVDLFVVDGRFVTELEGHNKTLIL